MHLTLDEEISRRIVRSSREYGVSLRSFMNYRFFFEPDSAEAERDAGEQPVHLHEGGLRSVAAAVVLGRRCISEECHKPKIPVGRRRQSMITIDREPTTPGEILYEEFLKPLNITQKQLADHLGCDVKVINRIVNNRTSISAEMAIKLGSALGTSPGRLTFTPETTGVVYYPHKTGAWLALNRWQRRKRLTEQHKRWIEVRKPIFLDAHPQGAASSQKHVFTCREVGMVSINDRTNGMVNRLPIAPIPKN